MSVWTTLALVWAVAAAWQAIAWARQRRTRNAGAVDVVWSASIGGAAIGVAALGDGAVAPRVALAVLGGAWGARLAWHLWRRVRRGPEDGRYAALRARWGDADAKWFGLYQLQAALVPLFALPFVAVARVPVDGVTPWLVGGIAVWLVGVGGEALADAQLARFRADPAQRGRTLRSGLWRYSRHPNYFFEWVHWFAYVLLAVGSPLAALAWAGPVVMFVFLRWLSGVPWTEAQAMRTRGDDYRDYVRTTPMFFPWFPTASARSDR